MTKKIPDHVNGLLQYLAKPNEKANEDMAINYFRRLFPQTFTRQEDAKRSDGFVDGVFVLELKGKSTDWLKGLCQGIAYGRELDFASVVVAAERFLALWRVEDIPEDIRQEIAEEKGAASEVGKRVGARHNGRKKEILRLAAFQFPDELLDSLFGSKVELVVSAVKEFEEVLKAGKKVRHKVTPRNFLSVLQRMTEFFDEPVKAVRAFYGIIFGWDDEAHVEISAKHNDQATVGGETVTHLIPGKRFAFKEFIESHAVKLGVDESHDDFFAEYDRALDTADPAYRTKHGIFFTDLDLSKYVMWFVKKHVGDVGKNYLVIDPACGSGNLVTNWKTPLELRHKVVSEIDPDLLFAVERRMKGDAWHNGKFTVVPKTSTGHGLNFLDRDAKSYLETLTEHLEEKGFRADKPLAFLCNPPYRSDDDQTAEAVTYEVHPSILELTGKDASSERYCGFLAQMKLICRTAEDSGLPGESLLLLFTKAAWLTKRPVFQTIRRQMLSAFEDVGGVLVNGKEFFDVSGKFPVAFTIWRFKGDTAGLDAERSVPLVDLTGVSKIDLATIPWTDSGQMHAQCEEVLKRGKSVALGVDRPNIREWSGLGMVDFKRGRRKDEVGQSTVGGLPKGDPRQANKKAYGSLTGRAAGFMDDLTPCRVDRDIGDAPHFHLDPRFMRVRAYQCFSGPADNRSFTPNSSEAVKKLFLWYAMGRVFAHVGYPLWVDAEELWAPVMDAQLADEMNRYAFAICFAENRCVETRFPANNPVKGAPEIVVTNPLSPNSPTSFWSREVAALFRRGASPAHDVVDAVCSLYSEWKKLFRKNAQIPAPFKRPYFVGDGELTASSGIVQIRDYATTTDNDPLDRALRRVQEQVNRLKEHFHDRLVARDGADYFGQGSARNVVPFTPRTNFDKVLERRLSIATVLVDRLHADKNFGRTKLAKLFYLADARAKDLDLKTQYARQAAGPLDARALYDDRVGIEPLARKHDYFRTEAVQLRGGKTMYRYEPGTNLNRAVKDAEAILGKHLQTLEEIIELCRPLDTDASEIVATLYACWSDLAADGGTPTDDQIADEFLRNWHPKKARFDRARLIRALKWMKKKGLTPAAT